MIFGPISYPIEVLWDFRVEVRRFPRWGCLIGAAFLPRGLRDFFFGANFSIYVRFLSNTGYDLFYETLSEPLEIVLIVA